MCYKNYDELKIMIFVLRKNYPVRDHLVIKVSNKIIITLSRESEFEQCSKSLVHDIRLNERDLYI